MLLKMLKYTKNLVGRDNELQALRALRQKTSSSLIVLWGRRRIGKSRLAEEFGKEFSKFYEFQGLGPRKGQTNQDQLDYFGEKLSEYFELPKMKLDSWSQAFTVLANQTTTNPVCILLDEISWMGGKDKDFPGRLKAAWDTQFSRNSKLTLIICGSVSAWINKNIINSTDFVGRISLSIQVGELSLEEANQFWKKGSRETGLAERFRALMLTGCVPKYLEEIATGEPISKQFSSKCFSKNGFFFQEFDRVFSDIFGRKAEASRKILEAISTKRMTTAQIALKIKRALNGKLTEDLSNLVLAGFVSREAIYLVDGSLTDKVYYRVKDNYIRFYLRLIAPKKKVIETERMTVSDVESLPNWNTFLGHQFENLVYVSLRQVYKLLSINSDRIVSAGPYLQTKNTRNKLACQVDLLINLKNREYYLCEIKSGAISKSVIKEVEKKIDAIKFPKQASVRPVLICQEIEEASKSQLEDYFYKIIDFSQLLGDR
jgi:AAA+ ATPase superfamily predicted ATPase